MYLSGTSLDHLRPKPFESYVLFVPEEAKLDAVAEAWSSLDKCLRGRFIDALNDGGILASNGGDVYPWKLMVASESEVKIKRMYKKRHEVNWVPGTKLGNFIQDCLCHYDPGIGSDYRELVERAISENRACKMVKEENGWTYELIDGEEYNGLAEKYGIIHPTLGEVNLKKVKA